MALHNNGIGLRNKILFIFATLVSTVVTAKLFHISVNAFFDQDSQINESIAQQNLPPWPASKVDDAAHVIFTQNSMVGFFRKISLTSSRQWLQFNSMTQLQYEQVAHCIATGQCSPLLIDLNRDRIQLGEPEIGVMFDLDNDGYPSNTQWVASGTDDGFLVRDLNKNGQIDNGGELFGQGTDLELLGARADNGYQALAQYDQASLGGNEDGRISAEDSIWNSLSLWIDANADAKTDANELIKLSDKNIVSISLDYVETNRRDAAGNYLPYWSWVTTNAKKGPKKLKMMDAFFKQIEEI